MNVVVVGAGRLGEQIAAALTITGNQVTVVESERNIAERLRGETKTRVIHGDGANPNVLEQAAALKADVLVAVSGQDQINLVVSLLAKRQFDVPRVVARVNEPENEWLFTDTWGVDVAVSASTILLSLIQEATRTVDTVGLLRLGTAGVNLIESTITTESSAVGKPLSELRLPDGTIVAAVLRHGQPTVPTGSYTLQVGDEVIIISESATRTQIRDVFQNSP